MSDSKQFAFGSDDGESVMTITYDGEVHDPDEGFARPSYRVTITTEHWEYSAPTVLGAQRETSDLDKASQSAFFYLYECVREENDDFPINVRSWASRYIDEIETLATPSKEENPTMVLHNGSLVESDEDTFDF